MPDQRNRSTMDPKLTPGRWYGGAIVALSIWFLRGLLQGVLAASVAAIASRPLCAWFAAFLVTEDQHLVRARLHERRARRRARQWRRALEHVASARAGRAVLLPYP